MNRTLAKWALACAIGAALPLAMALTGLSRALGAHPWWAVQTAVIGVAVGVAASLVFAFVPPLWRGLGGLGLLALSGGAAFYGKTQFAASFAEDAFAGQLWYFGWIGVAAGLAITAIAVLAPASR